MPNGVLWLALIFSAEIFLLIPLDAVLLFFCIHNRKKMVLYPFLAAAASTLSALIGFFVGYVLWEGVGPFVIKYLISEQSFTYVTHHFENLQHITTFLGAFLPLPMKLLSVSAGICKFNLFFFSTTVFAARLMRFSLVALAAFIWGEKVKAFTDKHFHKIFLLVLAKVAIIFGVFWRIFT